MSMWNSHLLNAAADFVGRGPARRKALVDRILADSEELRSCDDAALRTQALDLRWQARSGTDLARLVAPAYALIRESCRRTLGIAHHPVQVLGAIALFEGGVAEMQTGEGKTLTAVMPVFLRALLGKGAHVVTVNDYLAARDADWMRPAYERLGLSVGCIQTGLRNQERRAEYACDVTYATAKELGFDYLRDRLRIDASRDAAGQTTEAPVQRGSFFALVDEADCVLIDDARTPLIIALGDDEDPVHAELCRWSAEFVDTLLADSEFHYEPAERRAHLTDEGCRRIIHTPKPQAIDGADFEQIYRQVELALTARYGYARDRDYVVDRSRVVIVDESTGRKMEGRKWQDGLHQAVEAREKLPITAGTHAAAQITVQRFFRQYRFLAGMTGTAVAVRRELARTYRLRVLAIPTHRPCLRRELPVRIFATWTAKSRAIVDEIRGVVAARRAVLVGTPSVDSSERLSRALTEAGIEHRVLNARQDAEEARVVSRAGQSGAVTLATNMAGRGTDIVLDDEVAQHGGLHVIATERHSSARIDRQLVGRCARQGDPGSFRFFLSLEDELLRHLPADEVTRLQQEAARAGREELSAGWEREFAAAQRSLERRHARQRRSLLKIEEQRLQVAEQMGLDPCLEIVE